MTLKWSAPAAALACLAVVTAPVTSLADEGDLDGNRYLYERFYASEMSAAQAFLETVVKQGRFTNRADKLVIVDVRDATEYKYGHPDGAYHVPFPRVYQECNNNPDDPDDTVLRTEDGGSCLYGRVSQVTMSPEDFFLAVEALFPDKSQRLALLCRTGSRSVRGGNILSAPEVYLGPGYAGRGYSRVYNIWQGFVGQPMAPVHASTGRVIGPEDDVITVNLDQGETAFGFQAYKLDLNSDGVVDINDNDGWRYHQGLPYDTRMLPRLLNDSVMVYYDMP